MAAGQSFCSDVSGDSSDECNPVATASFIFEHIWKRMSPTPIQHTILTPWGTISGAARDIVEQYNLALETSGHTGNRMCLRTLRRFFKGKVCRLLIWK
jgi:hypothetical protein